MTNPITVFVVSDATGATAEAVATSVLVQFGTPAVELRRFPFTRSLEAVSEILDEAAERGGLVIFTFVSSELSQAMIDGGRQRGIVIIDLLGPLIALVADTLQTAPQQTPGVFRSEDEEMFKVTEAIHYTLRHDDGRGLDTIDQADLIILGLSRTGKTPTSIFLSCRKLKVANIPIVPGMELPRAVARLPVPKVGFVMSLERQLKVRGERSRRAGTGIPRYADEASIFAEMEHLHRVFRSIPGLRTVDVTERSIEETSDWIARNVL